MKVMIELMVEVVAILLVEMMVAEAEVELTGGIVVVRVVAETLVVAMRVLRVVVNIPSSGLFLRPPLGSFLEETLCLEGLISYFPYRLALNSSPSVHFHAVDKSCSRPGPAGQSQTP